jgi:hypothetical protein
MTFEDASFERAQKELEATEKLCSESAKKFSIKKAFGINNSTSKTDAQGSAEKQLEEHFTKAIIIADCKLYYAILTLIRQKVSAYLR